MHLSYVVDKNTSEFRYKVFVFKEGHHYGIELHVDKKTMDDCTNGYLKKSAKFDIRFKKENQILYQCTIDQRHLKLSNQFSDTYGLLKPFQEDILTADTIETTLLIHEKTAIAHSFALKACLHHPST